ncbi:MAG: inositol monophosphatase family protein [Patescibacteria group bacterium]
MNLIETLQNLEPIFIEAGQLAYKMQKGVSNHSKHNTGNNVIDIVTEADLAVQEFLLEAISKTDLVNCCLMAEENTPSVKKFNEQGKYYLAVDPIDGTAVYAKGGPYFSVIISLHDGKKNLYTFIYFPVFNWTHRIINEKHSVEGKTPEFTLPTEYKNSIIYWTGDPEKTIPELYNELKNKGIIFTKIGQDVGSIAPFVLNRVVGIYKENINVYDGMVEFDIATARGLKIYSAGADGKLDLSNIKKREWGLYYPGYYLALNNNGK